MSKKITVYAPWLLFFFLPVSVAIANIDELDNYIYQILNDPDDWYYIADGPTVMQDVDGSYYVCLTTEIRKNFQALWSIRLRQVLSNGTEVPIEGGTFSLSNPQDYNIKPLANFCLSFETYTGLSLPTDTGIYRMYVTWPMVDDNGRTQTQRAQSNLFEIN
jgi:hypothetical protein